MADDPTERPRREFGPATGEFFVSEIREALRSHHKNGGGKVSLDRKSWVSFAGLLLVALGMAGGLATAYFQTREGCETNKHHVLGEVQTHREIPAHPQQQAATVDIKKEIGEQRTLIHNIDKNIATIGERLRIRVERRREQE